MKHRSKWFIKWSAVLCAVLLLLSIIPFSVTFAVSVSDESTLKTQLTNGNAITLTEDIVISNGMAMGIYDYNATFNGNGHVIKGLVKPLFNTLGSDAVVKNVGVCAAESGGAQSASGYMALLAAQSQGDISGCFAYGDMSYTGTGVVGGLVGEMTGGSVTDSFSCIQMTADTASYVGGLVGKISGGEVEGCYSSGSIHAAGANTHTAGLANLTGGTAEDTYTSCQLLKSTLYARPSGVDGLYDNQMSLVRESKMRPGASTLQVTGANDLPAGYSPLSTTYFAVTSTAYPGLKSFLASSWSEAARDIVTVSTAAVSLSDVEGESDRHEPTSLSDAFQARADYITASTYADKTNIKSLKWSIDSTACKMYDTVPFTKMPLAYDTFTTGTHASLLRSKMEFSADANDAQLTATSGSARRVWHLTVRLASNPYYGAFYGNSESSYFPVSGIDTFQYVRYYSCIGPAYYQLKTNLTLSNWTPIADFDGYFNGDNCYFTKLTIHSDYNGTNYGVFANTQPNATITNVNVHNAKINTSLNETATTVGALVGTTGSNTKITDIVMYGTDNVIKGNATVGGLVGSAERTTFTQCLVSVELEGLGSIGAIAGKINGGSLKQCGSTGYVACGTKAGGLVGEVHTNKATFSHSYSTAMVLSDASSSKVGGLVGVGGASTFSYCYAANLADAINGTAHPLRASGSGSLSDNTFFDVVHALNSHENLDQKRTTEQLKSLSWSDGYWTITDSNYPQLKFFYEHSSAYQNALSAMSTTPIVVQDQWQDVTDDLTTGWIGSTAVFNTPTKLSPFDNGTKAIAALEATDEHAGYMFELAPTQRRVVLRSSYKTNSAGVRVIAFVQEDLIPIRYNVTGAQNAKAYVQLYYGSDEAGWKHYEAATVSGGNAEVLYNIPKGQQVKVQVESDDAYAVKTVTITCAKTTDSMSFVDGFYTLNKTFDSEIVIQIDMTTQTPAWGLRRQSY